MSRQNWSEGQVITSDDLNKATLGVEQTMLEQVIKGLLEGRSGFVGTGFKVMRASGTTFTINAGFGVYTDSSQTTPETKFRPLHNADGTTIYIITNPHATLARKDTVQVRAKIDNEASASRDIKDGLGTVAPATVVIRKKWTYELQIKDGTPAGSPTAPAVDSGWVKIGEIHVTAVTGIVNQAAITDSRTVMDLWDSLDARLDTLEGQNLNTRIGTLEGQTLDARLDVIEAQNLNTRLGVAETDINNLESADVALDLRLDALEAAPTSGTATLGTTGWAGSPTIGCKWSKHNKRVTLHVPMPYLTSNATATTLTGLPSALRPTGNQYFCLPGASDNGGAPAVGLIEMLDASTTISLYKSQTATNNWTASGLKGASYFTITYYSEY